VLDLILQGSVQGSVRAGQLSYEGKIDLCEVNLTRVQLIGTCEAKRPAPETISIPASNGIVLGGFVTPRLWSGLSQSKTTTSRQINFSRCLKLIRPSRDRLKRFQMHVLSTAPALRRGQHANEKTPRFIALMPFLSSSENTDSSSGVGPAVRWRLDGVLASHASNVGAWTVNTNKTMAYRRHRNR